MEPLMAPIAFYHSGPYIRPSTNTVLFRPTTLIFGGYNILTLFELGLTVYQPFRDLPVLTYLQPVVVGVENLFF